MRGLISPGTRRRLGRGVRSFLRDINRGMRDYSTPSRPKPRTRRRRRR